VFDSISSDARSGFALLGNAAPFSLHLDFSTFELPSTHPPVGVDFFSQILLQNLT
jgi:hypothetical protein